MAVSFSTRIPNIFYGKPSPSCGFSMALRTSPPKLRMPPEKVEIFKYLEPWAEKNLLPHLKQVEKSWQPQDFLPNPCSGSEFREAVLEIRERAANLPDGYLVCMVGNMITEEALPTYQTVFNTFEGVNDETGASTTAWATWVRGWSAEENRHGDLLNKYLWLTGRLDMHKVEKTVQYLIGAGMDIGTEKNPYYGFVYTSFQERATAISHGNTAAHAKRHGDAALARICGTIAADEKRHEAAYTAVVSELLRLDPDTTVRAIADMMHRRIAMPATLMFDGEDRQLFAHYSAVAQKVGVYTTRDYADIVEHLVLKRWEVDKIACGELSDEGRKAQDYVCCLADRIRKTEERVRSLTKKERAAVKFSWIFNREIVI